LAVAVDIELVLRRIIDVADINFLLLKIDGNCEFFYVCYWWEDGILNSLFD
jgi:hypothetical protein